MSKKKFVIMWNCGYGNNYDVVEAETFEQAELDAYEAWRDEAESNADYWAKPLTRELAENYDLEEHLDEDKAK